MAATNISALSKTERRGWRKETEKGPNDRDARRVIWALGECLLFFRVL